MTVVDVQRMLTGRRTDVHAHAHEEIGVPLKYEGEPDVFLLTNESYMHDRWANPQWRLTGARHRLRVVVLYDGGPGEQDYWIHNRGPRRDDVALEKIAG